MLKKYFLVSNHTIQHTESIARGCVNKQTVILFIEEAIQNDQFKKIINKSVSNHASEEVITKYLHYNVEGVGVKRSDPVNPTFNKVCPLVENK